MNKQRLTAVDNQSTKTGWFDLDKTQHLFTIPGSLLVSELLYTKNSCFILRTGDSYYAFSSAQLLVESLITDSACQTHDMLMDKVAELYASVAEATKRLNGAEYQVMTRKRDAATKLKKYFESEEY